MPAAVLNFDGLASSSVTPPDPIGAAGLSRYVQLVNGKIEIFDKSGAVVQAAKAVNTLWTGYTGTNAGNGCAARNDGDPIVRYDRLADRWIIMQVSAPNSGANSNPSFECVAVSKTADPAGAYWLYDFQFPGFPDQTKLGVWPDAYYVATNLFTSGYLGPRVCAWNRAAMLAGLPATPQCFALSTSYIGLLPADFDGTIAPPAGSPEYLLAEDATTSSTLDFWKFHVDWNTPSNSTLSAPTALSTGAFTDPACGQPSYCIPQAGTTQKLDAMPGRLMDRLAYRNLGDHESLVVNHSVTAGSVIGPRWYELRIANQTPSIYQQGTYSPDGNYRWMGSIAQDHAGNMALGYSLSAATMHPAIAWTGRLATDPLGVMGQAETTLVTGAGSETSLGRWGDYTSMSVDPSDDCTFWYTNEYYTSNGTSTWQTRIATVKFPSCGNGDFSIGAAPATVSVQVATPPPAPSNVITVLSDKASKTHVITLSVSTSTPGAISALATFVETIKHTKGKGRHRHTVTTHRTITYGKATATATGKGTVMLNIRPTRAASRLLASLHSIEVSIVLTFTPTGGTTNTKTLHLRVTAPKRKHH
jgi:hypothetical protein